MMHQISNEQILSAATDLIAARGLKNITPSDILSNKQFETIRRMIVIKLEKAAAEAAAKVKAEADEAKADEAKALEELLRAEIGIIPLTAKEIQDKLKAKQASDAATETAEVPSAVTALAEKFGETLPPEVFTDPEWAMGWRGWFGQWPNKIRQDLSVLTADRKAREVAVKGGDEQATYETEMIDALLVANQARQQEVASLLHALTEVVKAWGKDPRVDKAPGEYFQVIWGNQKDAGARFYRFTQRPTAEHPREKAQREEAEAAKRLEAAKEAEALAKRLKWATDKFVDASAPVDLAAETADDLATRQAMSARLAERAIKKFNGNFAAFAVAKAIEAKSDEDTVVALLISKVAEMSPEDLAVAVQAERAKREAKAAADAQAVADKRGKDYGAEKPSTAVARANAKKGNQGGGKRNK